MPDAPEKIDAWLNEKLPPAWRPWGHWYAPRDDGVPAATTATTSYTRTDLLVETEAPARPAAGGG